jgi:uncharacterized protein (TIGR02453 family)
MSARPTEDRTPWRPSPAFRSRRLRSSGSWFNAHKAVYEAHVKGPMVELVTQVADDLRKFAVDCVPDKPEKAIYRIYRDTRFSKDKTPYKTHVAAHFQHRQIPKNTGAGFYFAVSHKSLDVGGGMYMPGPDQLAATRAVLLDRHEEFRKLCSDKSLTKSLGKLLGDKLARVPKGFDAEHPASEFLRMKQFYFYAELDPKLALSAKVRKEIVDRFKRVAPIVAFLNEALLIGMKGDDDDRPVRPAPMF